MVKDRGTVVDTSDPELEVHLRELVDRFERATRKTLTEAEDHLKIPHATLVSIEEDTDFMFVMKMWCTLEPLLNDALRAEVKGGLKKLKVEHDGAGALAEFVAKGNDTRRKISLARDLGIISEERQRYCEALFEVRNRYAHNIGNMHWTLFELLSQKFTKNESVKLWRGLTGGTELKHAPPGLKNFSLRFHSLYQFASFLADVLHVIKPPPWKGLLGEQRSALAAALEQDPS